MRVKPLPADTGVILVDHGSKFDAANAMLEEVARAYEVFGAAIVEPAHMELASPTLSEAFARCVRRGARRVVVHPYFLAPGRHSTRDIPNMVQEAARRFREVPFVVTDPIGLDPRVLEIVHQRIEEALGRS